MNLRFMTNIDMIGQVMFNYAPHRTVRIIKKVYKLGMWIEEGENEYAHNFCGKLHRKMSLGKLRR